jgi:hypothetical protein
MTSIESVTLEVPDPAAAGVFYTSAFGLGDRVCASVPRRHQLPVFAGSCCRSWCPSRAPSSPVRLALYSRRAAAKDAGVSPDGTGSHRIVIGSDAGPFTDPDGFA